MSRRICPERPTQRCRRLLALLLLWSAVSLQYVSSFQTRDLHLRQIVVHTPSFLSPIPSFRRVTPTPIAPHTSRESGSTSTSLNMFMGSDGGLLGVGGPEIFTILLVGYFVLGPSDLYKLVKEIGKFIQNIRTLGSDLSTTFENNMESSLQLDELRKAQRELNDAFSFRRSINVDADSEAFSVQAGSAQENMAAAEASTVVAATASTDMVNATSVPKKIRRRVRKRETEATSPSLNEPVYNIPDLEMPEPATATSSSQYTEQELAVIESDFDKYVSTDDASVDGNRFGWDKMDDAYAMNTDGLSRDAAVHNELTNASETAAASAAAQSRFQQQVSGNWNDQILQANDKLEPMALVMNKIALLEQEKLAALRRLEDEFAKRTELEERFYRDQRKLLEETATDIQSVAFGLEPPKKTV